ncbi:MAG: cyclic nucleotide-binding domain-containing protein [Verrucomicrobia bacterium]|nr:cyclic nucleotide-binding domain-containing protein [Verrucomicrobiota bacterium]
MNPVFFQNRLFADIPVDVLEATPVRERVFAPETVIFREGDHGDTLMLVGSGLVKISKAGWQGHEVVLSLIEANDFFGELALLDREPRSASAIALKNTVIGEIDRSALDFLMEKAPRVLPVNFTQVAIARLRSTNASFVQHILRSERLAVLGTMLSSIVHDLKNPLAAITSSVSYLEQKAPDDFTKSAAHIIKSSADRVVLLTEELLDFARGTARLSPTWTTSNRLLDLLETEILDQVRRTTISVEVENRTKDSFWIDEMRVTRCLANVVKNAWEAMRDRGKLRLEFEGRDSGLFISVADSGPGIPEEFRSQIFEPFMTYRKRTGTGLGLSIAKSCVEAHEGKISFESRPGEGTTFFIWLPKQSQKWLRASLEETAKR